jgi:hypothetical protein
MTPAARKGFALALIHLAVVASLGGKLLIDRATRPRVWARTAPVDPNLPIRGRYVRLRVEGELKGAASHDESRLPVRVSVENQTLVFERDSRFAGVTASTRSRENRRTASLDGALAYFIPEHVPDPSMRLLGEELWVELTVPRRGAPRPIRLGVKKDGVLTPLDLD